jgi:hypothetical protein
MYWQGGMEEGRKEGKKEKKGLFSVSKMRHR